MATNAEYQARIQSYDRSQLLNLWDHIQRNETPDWEPGRALEYLVIRAFELENAEVAYPFTVQMGGTIVEQIDGAVHTNGLSCLIECKDQSGNVSIDPIAKLKNQLSRRPGAAIGSMFSSTSFTEATVYLSQYNMNQTVLLWNSDDIAYGLTHQFMGRGLFSKYWYCVQTGKTDYNLLLEGVT
jgi:Restriction endonuclease